MLSKPEAEGGVTATDDEVDDARFAEVSRMVARLVEEGQLGMPAGLGYGRAKVVEMPAGEDVQHVTEQGKPSGDSEGEKGE
ncbi:unnamed protein product, partial [Mesorhabditis spiculigera]